MKEPMYFPECQYSDHKMPSMTSTAVTQANQDNQIQTVTIRCRRDEGQSKCTDDRKVIGPLVKMNINDNGEQTNNNKPKIV